MNERKGNYLSLDFVVLGGEKMTKKKLEELVRLSNKIDNIKRDIEELNYIKDDDYIFLSAKDGRVMYEKYAYCRIPRSLTQLICTEVENKLKIELESLEREFEEG